MPDPKLKLADSSALVVLLKDGGEVPNAEFKQRFGFELRAESRRRLEKLGLIEVRKEGQRIHLSVSEKGWSGGALDVFDLEPPARSGATGALAATLLEVARHYLKVADIPLSEYLQPGGGYVRPGGGKAGASDAETGELIRKAYAGLAREPGESVLLSRLRAELPDVDRATVDEALIALDREPGVRVFAQSNQKTLTGAEREAAVSIGNQDKHLISIK